MDGALVLLSAEALACGACEVVRELDGPGPFAEGVDLYPSVTFRFAKFESAGTSGHVEMPVVASRATREFAVAHEDEPVALALG